MLLGKNVVNFSDTECVQINLTTSGASHVHHPRPCPEAKDLKNVLSNLLI